MLSRPHSRVKKVSDVKVSVKKKPIALAKKDKDNEKKSILKIKK